MGRWTYSNRTESDSLKKIQTWWLKKYGYFIIGWKSGTIKWTNGWTGQETSIGISVNVFGADNHLRIFYTQTEMDGEKKNFDYKVTLTTTRCNFGGERYWFICPLTVNGIYCGKRVGTLYKAGDYFGCRHCYNLTYNSRKLSGIWKSAGAVISIPELEKLESEVKRKFYAGRMTRRYRRYLKKQDKSLYQLQVMARAFSK